MPFKASQNDRSETHYLYTGDKGHVFWFEESGKEDEYNLKVLRKNRLEPVNHIVKSGTKLYEHLHDGASFEVSLIQELPLTEEQKALKLAQSQIMASTAEGEP